MKWFKEFLHLLSHSRWLIDNFRLSTAYLDYTQLKYAWTTAIEYTYTNWISESIFQTSCTRSITMKIHLDFICSNSRQIIKSRFIKYVLRNITLRAFILLQTCNDWYAKYNSYRRNQRTFESSNRNVFFSLFSKWISTLVEFVETILFERSTFLRRSKKAPKVLEHSIQMKANKNINQMKIMIIIIVQPLITAIKIDPYSIRMESIWYETRTRMSRNLYIEYMNMKKIKIICFKNCFQMFTDKIWIELNWIKLNGEQRTKIHILKYLKRKSIHAITLKIYELIPIYSFSSIPNQSAWKRNEESLFLQKNLNNSCLLFHRHSLMCHIIFGFERPFVSALKKEKLKIYMHIKAYLVNIQNTVCYSNHWMWKYG